MSEFTLSPSVREAFTTFCSDTTAFALRIALRNKILESQAQMIAPDASIDSIQSALNLLRPILDTRSAAYLILRLPQYKRLIAATFVPYLAPKDDRDYFLAHRYDLVRELGAQHFEVELVCKEVGEILDARSWEERDETRMSGDEIGKEQAEESEAKEPEGVVDLGYVKTKCRLCDRRMQNGIEDTALSALRELKNQPGNAVILYINLFTSLLTLVSTQTTLSPSSLSAIISATNPSYTFYYHPVSKLIYFFAYSPDSAIVKERMTHTMGIPGVLVHAEDCGVDVDRRREIHDLGDLGLEMDDGEGDQAEKGDGDEKIEVKYRSMFERKAFKGTELVYGNLESDRQILEGIV